VAHRIQQAQSSLCPVRRRPHATLCPARRRLHRILAAHLILRLAAHAQAVPLSLRADEPKTTAWRLSHGRVLKAILPLMHAFRRTWCLE
jgi:hypothetical protein